MHPPRQLLNHTVGLPQAGALHAFEFGNEVCGDGVSFAQWAKDATTLAGLISSAFRGAGLSYVPSVIGPDCGWNADGYAQILDTVGPAVLSAVTYHQYPQVAPL